MTEQEQLEQKLESIRDLILAAERSVGNAKRLMNSVLGKKNKKKDEYELSELHEYNSGDDRVIEGVFTGDQMLGSDKSLYPVPANYASKSLLIQGSKMKAIVDPNGKITYKIIEEMPYDTKIGVLIKEGSGYQVVCDGAAFNVLLASVTYHHGAVGDRVTIRVPQGENATFAAIEAIVQKDSDTTPDISTLEVTESE